MLHKFLIFNNQFAICCIIAVFGFVGCNSELDRLNDISQLNGTNWILDSWSNNANGLNINGASSNEYYSMVSFTDSTIVFKSSYELICNLNNGKIEVSDNCDDTHLESQWGWYNNIK